MGNFMPGIESSVETALGQLHDALGELKDKTWEVPATQAADGLEQIRAWLSETIAAVWSGESPPPAPPLMAPPGPPLGVFLDSLATEHVNTLTVAEIGDILFKESEGTQPGQAGAWELEEGKLATVHAIMNGDLQRGARRPSTSQRKISAKQMQTAEYQEDLRIAEEAYYDRRIYGTDMSDDRIYFGNRYNASIGPRLVKEGRRIKKETVYHRYGPFLVRRRAVYIDIFNEPQ